MGIFSSTADPFQLNNSNSRLYSLPPIFYKILIYNHRHEIFILGREDNTKEEEYTMNFWSLNAVFNHSQFMTKKMEFFNIPYELIIDNFIPFLFFKYHVNK